MAADNEWYSKLNILECSIQFLVEDYSSTYIPNGFIQHLNFEFKRLNFAYRIIDNKIVDITMLKNKMNYLNKDKNEKTKDYVETYFQTDSFIKESVNNYSSSDVYFKYKINHLLHFITKIFKGIRIKAYS